MQPLNKMLKNGVPVPKLFQIYGTLRNFMVSPLSGAFLDAPFSHYVVASNIFNTPADGSIFSFGVVIALIIGLLIEKNYNLIKKKQGRPKI